MQRGFTLTKGAAQRILARVKQSETRLGESCVEPVDPPKFKNVDLLPTKYSGFTLAEVLITLGIIGVVAALTIPGLINNYKAARLHSQFLKSYSTVQQAFRQMEADDVSLNPNDYVGKENMFVNQFKKYFKVGVDCGVNGEDKGLPCYDVYGLHKTDAKRYTALDGKTLTRGSFFDDGQFVLNDGTLIIINQDCYASSIYVSVDLNGAGSPPNRWGYDLFTFYFADGVFVTVGDKKTSYTMQTGGEEKEAADYADMSKYCSAASTDSMNGIACAQKAKENPDYFKELIKEFK